MSEEKISVSWDELNQAKVDRRLKEQEAIARTKKYSQMDAGDVPTAPAQGVGPSIWYNPIISVAVFGLIGGLLAWGAGVLLHLRPDPRILAAELVGNVQLIEREYASGQIATQAQEQRAIDEIIKIGRDNPYFMLEMDEKLTSEQKAAERNRLARGDDWRDFITNVVSYGVCGLMIAVCLSVAEPIVDRNRVALVVNGSVGATLGLIGGVFAAFIVDRVYNAVLKAPALGGVAANAPTATQQMIARAVTYGALGSVLTLAPGLVMRNFKRLLIGVLGGAIGGIIGGLLFDPVARLTEDTHYSKLIAYVAIGLIAGAATGLIEQAAKTGWVKVTGGLIAGKQFIIYRNPTYIGSAPDCQIYLFKDPQIGRRHAAIHLVKGGFEIEDLPLGGKTLVNDAPVSRTRLRNGDKIQIGATTFSFQQKIKGK